MKVVYLLSVFYLIISFLLLKKTNKKLSIVSSVIYTICLLFCYNTVIVCFYSFFKINGSLLVLSLFNYGIGSILNFISFRRKEIQKFTICKKELITVCCVLIVAFLVGFFRFSGFKIINYETGDPAIHYRSALHFARELEILDTNNSKDLVYNDFNRFMPISYINSGLLLNVFSEFSSYKVFVIYDVLCLILSSLLFFITIFNLFQKKSVHIFYCFILTLLYLLAFPLNNLVFGFCYLGLGIMAINLLFLTVSYFKDFNEQILFKLIMLFILTFSLFFSYYLFMPCVYLALGIYYIYLWKKNKISVGKLFLYGIVTLIIPFIIGIVYFVLPSFINESSMSILKKINLYGYIYSNITPMYLFFVVSGIIIYKLVRYKEKIDYFKLNLYIISIYILIFFVLYIFKLSEVYYFYKLFYLYWFFVIIFLGQLLVKWKKYVYVIFSLILVGMGIVYYFPNSKVTLFLTTINIYNWNIRTFNEDRIIFTESELEIMDESVKYKDICEYKNEFLILGSKFKNFWFYSYTGSIPVFNYQYVDHHQLYETNIGFRFWENLANYDCLVYFYEDSVVDYDKDNYEVLYSNEDGAILKKK